MQHPAHNVRELTVGGENAIPKKSAVDVKNYCQLTARRGSPGEKRGADFRFLDTAEEKMDTREG